MWTYLCLRFAALFRRTRFEHDLADELAFHVESRTEEWERRGLPPSAARRRALIELGSAERIKEEVRDVRLGRWLEVLRQDLHYGFRVLRAHPSFERSIRIAVSPLAGLALFGLVLATIGLTGVTSYAVARRRREIGIRLALGAERLHVLWLVLREGTFLVVTGAVLGAAGAFALSRALSALDPDLARVLGAYVGDRVLLVGAPMLLVAAALLACAVPAWRAVRD